MQTTAKNVVTTKILQFVTRFLIGECPILICRVFYRLSLFAVVAICVS